MKWVETDGNQGKMREREGKVWLFFFTWKIKKDKWDLVSHDHIFVKGAWIYYRLIYTWQLQNIIG